MTGKKVQHNDVSENIDVIGKKLDTLVSIVVAHDKRFDSIDKKFESIDKRFDSIDKKFDSIDKKFASNDKKFSSIDKRFDSMDAKMDRIIGVMATKDEMRALEERLGEVERTVTHISSATDGMVGTYETLYVEYVAIKMQLSRYDRWFEEISKKTGVKLEY